MARILVVDDELANRELMAYLLRHFGHEVTTAPDGAGALRTALAEHPDLVVMDVAMPGMDGYTAARLMRAEQALSDVRLVAVSATGVASLAAARAAGFDAFYPMPIEPGELMALLEPFIRAPAVDGAGEGEPR